MRNRVRDDRTLRDKAMSVLVHRHKIQDPSQNPVLGRCQLPMRSGQTSRAAALFGNLKRHIMHSRRRFTVERQPPQSRHRQPHGIRNIGRTGHYRQAGGLQLFDVGSAIGQTPGHTSPQKHNVRGFSMLHLFKMSDLFESRRLFLFRFAPLPFFARFFDGARSGRLNEAGRVEKWGHLTANVVNSDELGFCDQSHAHHRSINRLNLRRLFGWD